MKKMHAKDRRAWTRAAAGARPTGSTAPSGIPARGFIRAAWLGLGLPVPELEYRFAPPRRWRFDYAWPVQKVALEIQGGIFTRGRHTQGAALLKEYEKLNAAAVGGWRVLFITPKEMRNGAVYRLIGEALSCDTAGCRGERGHIGAHRV